MKSEIKRLLAGHHRRDPLTPDPLPKRGEGDKLSLGNGQSGRRGWSKRSSGRPRPFWGEGWGEGANPGPTRFRSAKPRWCSARSLKEILDEAFALVGKDVVLAHAKDLDHDGDAGHKAAGQGKLDYDRYLSLLHSCRFPGPLLLHGLSEAQVSGCVAFLREKITRLTSPPSGR